MINFTFAIAKQGTLTGLRDKKKKQRKKAKKETNYKVIVKHKSNKSIIYINNFHILKQTKRRYNKSYYGCIREQIYG